MIIKRKYLMESISNRYCDIEDYIENRAYDHNLEVKVKRAKGILMSDYNIVVTGDKSDIDFFQKYCTIKLEKYKTKEWAVEVDTNL